MKIKNILVGAPKAGTTWLYKQLSYHPDLSLSWKKETNVFLSDQDINPKDHWVGSLNLTDISPDYFMEELVAKRITQHNPSANILISLRHPVDRALSHYLMLRSYGLPEVDPRHIGKELRWVQPSLYSKWVRIWQEYFGSQVLVLDFNLIDKHPALVLDKVYTHLDVERQIEGGNVGAPIFVSKGAARFPYLSWLVTKQYTKLLRGSRFQSGIVRAVRKCGLAKLYHHCFTLDSDYNERASIRERLEVVLVHEVDWYESFSNLWAKELPEMYGCRDLG